jgi:hypothetical protein
MQISQSVAGNLENYYEGYPSDIEDKALLKVRLGI